MRIDYEFKSSILKSDILKEFKDINKAKYNFIYHSVLDTKYTYEQALNKEYELFYDNFEVWNECRKIDKAFLSRKSRLKKRIEKYLNMGTCYFVTLTFHDKALKSTDEATRRKYVTRYLKSLSNHYVANQDFGDNHKYIDNHGKIKRGTGREHYHGLIVADQYNLNWEYGFSYFEKCNNNTEALSKYISKLTNHAIKDSNKRSVMIYSKGD